MSILRYSVFQFGDIEVVYQLDDATRAIGLTMVPSDRVGDRVPRRDTLTDGPEYDHLPGWTMPAWAVDPLVQVQWIGAEPPGGFIQGRSMRGGPATQSLKFEWQEILDEGNCTT